VRRERFGRFLLAVGRSSFLKQALGLRHSCAAFRHLAVLLRPIM
jgi:hypothetical protein